MEQISLAVNGEETGPFSKTQVESMYRAGLLNSETYYWLDGMAEWRPINELIQEDNTRPTETPTNVSLQHDDFSTPGNTEILKQESSTRIARPKGKAILFIAASCVLIAVVLGIVGTKNGWWSSTEVNGTIFIVSADAGVHKLAATNVALCDASNINASISDLALEHQTEVAEETKTIDNLEAEYIESERQLVKAAYKYSYLFRLFATDEDKSFSIAGFSGSDPNGFSHNPNVIAISACFDKAENLTLLDPKDVSDLKILVDSLGKEIEQATTVDDLQKASIMTECPKSQQQVAHLLYLYFAQQKQLLSEISHLQDIQKQNTSKLFSFSTNSAYTLSTDSDGTFSQVLKRAGDFILFAKGSRSIDSNTDENYMWVVPFSIAAGESKKIDLSNRNELLSGNSDVLKIENTSHWDTSTCEVASVLKGFFKKSPDGEVQDADPTPDASSVPH